MKLLLRIGGICCLIIATLFFLYGAVKLSRAQQKDSVELAPGIVALHKGPDQSELATKGFSLSAVFGVAGVVLLLFSRAVNKNETGGKEPAAKSGGNEGASAKTGSSAGDLPE